jgi:hypothetical protein
MCESRALDSAKLRLLRGSLAHPHNKYSLAEVSPATTQSEAGVHACAQAVEGSDTMACCDAG